MQLHCMLATDEFQFWKQASSVFISVTHVHKCASISSQFMLMKR